MDKHVKYRLNNQDKIKQANKRYYEENKEEILKLKRERYERDREKILPMLREKTMCEHCEKFLNKRYLQAHILRRHSEKNSCIS